MRLPAAFLLLAAALWAQFPYLRGGAPPFYSGSTFTSVRSGDWRDPATWGGAGSGVCHLSIPCATDASGGGDLVLLGNLTHTVTCAAMEFCSAGSSPSSDAGAVAVGAVSYAANAALVVDGTLTVAGPVRMPAATWTNSGTIVVDASWSSSPLTAAYSWTTNNIGNASQGGHFQNDGLVMGAGNSHGVSACDSNACRSGTFGLDGAGALAFNDQGNVGCAGGAFRYVGQVSNGSLSVYSNLNAAARTFSGCWFDSLQTIEFVESTRSGAFVFSGGRVTNPLNTNSSQGSITWLSGGAPSAPCSWSNSDLYGIMYYYGGSSAANLNCTWVNVIHEASALGGGQGWQTTNYSTGSSDQDLWYVQWPGGDSAGGTLANGMQSRGVVATYVNPGQNNGMNDMHPVSVVQGAAGNTIRGWFVEGNNFGAVSSFLEPQGGPPSVETLEIENVVQTCGPQGVALGDAINIDGGFLSNSRIQVDNITACSDDGDPASDTHVMGIGGEAQVFYAGGVPHVYSSLFYSDSGANGPTEALCGGSGATFPAGTISVWGYNAYYFTAGGGPYCSVGIANYVASFVSNTVIAAGRGPAWFAGGRRLINFDQYLGYPVSSVVWASGVTYSPGAVVSDSQAGQYGGASFNWLFLGGAGCAALASSANRPMTGAAWSQCWEPAAMTYIRAAALAGTTYAFAPTGASGLGVVGLLNAWAMQGYSPVGEGGVIAAGGFGGTYIGAVPPM